MNQRLETIYRLISPGRGVVDVGTDHGYLPTKLALSDYPGAIYASDINEGPLNTARATAKRAGTEGRIRFLLADGLDACPPSEIDTIVVAGMGGEAICGILDRAEWCLDPSYRLILQPMTKGEILRYWLTNNGFHIEAEALAEDKGTIYQIIAARYCDSNETLTDAELCVGKFELTGGELFRRLLSEQIRRVERRLAGILSSAAESECCEEKAALQGLLNELNAWKDYIDERNP